MKRAPFVVAVLLGLLACSPTIRVEATFTLPKGGDPARLHVRGRSHCPHEASDAKKPEPPPPGVTETGEESMDVVAFRMENGVAKTQIHGTHCWLAMTAFYDADGNGEVGPGDSVGTVPATEVVDRGLCMGNLNVIGPVALAKR